MKSKTPNYPLRERLSRTVESLWAAAGRAAPARLRYWVLIAEGVKRIEPHEEVPAVPFTVVLERAGQALR